MNEVRVTMLTHMACKGDFCAALDRLSDWKIDVLDLKNDVWGKFLIELTDEEAQRAAREIERRGLSTYCLSSMLFHQTVESGEAAFREELDVQLARLIELAHIFRPKYVRLLSPQMQRRDSIYNSISYIGDQHSWLFECYREAAGRIDEAGFVPTIENEARSNIFSSAREITDFFDALDVEPLQFTWDIQNLWAMGTFPTLAVYEQLRPYTGYVHFKGGRVLEGSNDQKLFWRSPLEDASWPVRDICLAVIKDNCSPVLCLNPSHGQPPEGYDRAVETRKDLEYLRSIAGGHA